MDIKLELFNSIYHNQRDLMALILSNIMMKAWWISGVGTKNEKENTLCQDYDICLEYISVFNIPGVILY